jgi:Diaphanous GTPase-binding Domain
MRQNLRSLKTTVKVNLIRGNELDLSALGGTPKSAPASTKDKHPGTPSHRRGISESDIQYETDDGKKSGKRGRARSKTFTFSKSGSPSKKQKGNSVSEASISSKLVNLPKSPSVVSLVNGMRGSYIGEGSKSSIPEDFVSYLRSEQQPEKVEVGKVHRLRQILRNETVSWVETFIKLGGMTEIVDLLHRIMKVEWRYVTSKFLVILWLICYREEHEDQLLHEALLCLKALCTTDIALQKLQEMEKTLFPALLAMIFDPEHKGPSEYTTRGIVINILLAHLTSAVKDPNLRPSRAADILGYLSDPLQPEDKRPIPFILDMHQSRPYKVWHREASNVTKEVFWIFLHRHNVVPLPQDGNSPVSAQERSATTFELGLTADEYNTRYFPQPRPPVPAAPYVGGVEWDATNYLAAHLDLMNGIIAALPTREERNVLRLDMRNSGWEKLMGGTLRICKEKFYDCVHSGLRTWLAAAAADGWDYREVRNGPKSDVVKSPKKSPAKKADKPPVLDAPNLDLHLGLDELKRGAAMKDWI